MSFKVTIRDEKAKSVMAALKRAMSPTETSRVVFDEAEKTRTILVGKTPKRWTGQVRGGWRVAPITGGWMVTNDNPVMRMLEKGTQAHGPKRAKMLYIPLTSGASYGWQPKFQYGVHYVLAKRVRGIKAMKIVERERPQAQFRMKSAMISHVKRHVSAALAG